MKFKLKYLSCLKKDGNVTNKLYLNIYNQINKNMCIQVWTV